MAKRITYVCLVLSLTAIILSSFNLYLILREPRLPQTQFDYVIFQDKDLAKAENKRKGTIDFSSPNASFVINQAIEHGSNVYIQEGNYTLSSDIHIFNKQNAKITSDNASFTCNGHKIILKGDDYTKSQNNLLSGFQIINGTLRIENSFRTTITDMIFKDCATAIELVNTETWSEATKIEECHFINSTQGIVFRSPTGNATGSYANTEIEHCDFNLLDNSTGIVVEPKAKYNNGKVEGVTIWIGGYGNSNQTGILVEGSMYQTMLFGVVFESFADLPVDQLYGMVLEETADPAPILESGVEWLGNLTAQIYNPHDIWIGGVGGVFNQQVLDVEIGLNGQYGSTRIFHIRPLTIALFEAKIGVQGSFLNNESVTVRFRLEFVDHAVSNSVEKSFNQSASAWLDKDDMVRLLPSLNVISAILIDAKVDFEATDAVVRIYVYGVTT